MLTYEKSIELEKALDEWRTRSGKAERAAAEMRKALEYCEQLLLFSPAPKQAIPGMAWNSTIAIAQKALSSDAGRNYVHKDDVRPLVEALRGALVLAHCYADTTYNPQVFMDNNDNVIRMKDAIAHAREKGLL